MIMTKGPLTNLLIALALILMIISLVIGTNRDLFLQNQMLFGIVGGAVVIAIIVVLIVMFYRSRQLTK